jgi:hypothetical protein
VGTPPPSLVELRQTSRFAHAAFLLLVHWAGKGATKALRFAPRLTNLFPKTGEPGC